MTELAMTHAFATTRTIQHKLFEADCAHMGLTRLLGLLEPTTPALYYLLMAFCVTDITLSYYP